MKLRCLPLYQPWASAIALGMKKLETRGHPTHMRGLIGIYATKAFPKEAQAFAADEWAMGRIPANGTLPRGCLVAVVELAECRSTLAVRDGLSDLEQHYGDYSDGRYAWRLVNVRRLVEPFPARGKQGWFFVEVPDAVIAAAIPVVVGMDT